MTTAEWVAQAQRHTDILTQFVAAYHPAASGEKAELPITAPTVEMATAPLREGIAKRFQGDPVEQFRAALTAGDVTRIANLLSETWFGVPESTECWHVPGFKEAVDLLDDPPEEGDSE